ncbi:hypothetical protein ACRRTK_017418 [Alexandromys fortis]
MILNLWSTCFDLLGPGIPECTTTPSLCSVEIKPRASPMLGSDIASLCWPSEV